MITGSMLIVAIIHLLPISGALGVERLNALYGTPITDPNLEVLMRHRAVMFGILGAYFAYAAFVPLHQPAAFLAAFVSVGSFFYLVYAVGGTNDALRTVVIADVVAAVALVIAIALCVAKRPG
ncbi:MAG: hypothetical protein MI923_27295 [Phycisphaerales bacterium]|nr:hypothetical protein [Phycisphaerales bacterium]